MAATRKDMAMQATTLTTQNRPAGAVGSPGRWAGFRRVARLLARWASALGRRAARWSPCDDERYVRAAHSLEDVERRLQRLERHGNPLSDSFLP
jgi:hypothetical protein